MPLPAKHRGQRRPQPHGDAPVPDQPRNTAGETGEGDDRPFPHQRQWFIALLAAILLSRLALLFLSQRYLMSDEAVVGVMVQDILAGKPIPFFLYGQHYGGGHVVEALLMTPWFRLFGPRDLIVKAVPLALGLLSLLVLYRLVYRFFSRRLALLALGLNAFCVASVAGNFLVSGQMATELFTWTGLYFFFSHFYGERPRPFHLALAGAALGLGIYGYDYPIIFLAAILGLMLFRHRLGLWRQWQALAALGAGVLAGAAPLIVYLFRNQFKHFQSSAAPEDIGPSFPLQFCQRFYRLLVRDVPGSFQKDLYDYPPRIEWTSWLPWILFCAALAYLLIALRGPLREALRGLAGRRAGIADLPIGSSGLPPVARERRILCFLYFFVFFSAVYGLSRHAGGSPRYILPLYPFLAILLAWTVERLGRTRPAWAIFSVVAFLAPQAPQVIHLARDKLTEWGIPMDGRDLKDVVGFLEERRLTTVLAPYEIKWKLMFYSQRRITGAALVFGYDREMESNALTLNRIQSGEAPLVIVLDRNLLLPQVQKFYFPERVFDMEAFHAFLKRHDVQYSVTRIGDYVVYHDFSKRFEIFPSFYNQPLKALPN